MVAAAQLLNEVESQGVRFVPFIGPVAAIQWDINSLNQRINEVDEAERHIVAKRIGELGGIAAFTFASADRPDRGGLSGAVQSVPGIGNALSDLITKVPAIPVLTDAVKRAENNETIKKASKIGLAVAGPTGLASVATGAVKGTALADIPLVSGILGGKDVAAIQDGNLATSSPVLDTIGLKGYAKASGDSFLDKAATYAGAGKAAVAAAAGLSAGAATGTAGAAEAATGSGGSGPLAFLTGAGEAVAGLAATGAGVLGTIKGLMNGDRPAIGSDSIPLASEDPTGRNAPAFPWLLALGAVAVVGAGVYLYSRK